MKLWTSNYLIKLLMFSLLLGTIPVITVGVFSYFRASDTILDKVTEGNTQVLEQTELRVEQILKGVDNAVTQFINSPSLNSALHQKLWAAEFKQIDELSKGLYRIQSFQYGIQDVYLANIQNDWVISNQGIMHFEDWKARQIWVSFLGGNGTSFWLSHHDVASHAQISEQGISPNSVFLLKKLPTNAVSPLGFLLTVIPGYEVDKYLSQSSKSKNVTILDGGYRLLSTQSENQSSQQWATVVQRLKEESSPNGNFKIKFDRDEVLVSYRKSAYNGWVYVSVVPVEVLLQDSRSIGTFTAIICLIIMIAVLTFAYLGSRQMYSPVRFLYETVTQGAKPSMKGGLGGNEFEQIGQRVRNLMQTQTEMADRIKGQAGKLREYFVMKLLQSEISHKEIKEKTELFGLPDNWQLMSVLAVKIHSLEHTRYANEDRDLLMFAIQNIAGELFESDVRLDPVLINPYQVTLVGTKLQDADVWKKRVADKAEKLQRTVMEILEFPVSVGISRPFRQLSESSRAYKEALEALNTHLGFEEAAIISLEDIRPFSRSRSAFPERVYDELLDAVKLGERELAFKLLKSFMQELYDEEVTHEEYQFALLRLMMDLIRELHEQDESPQSLWGGDSSWLERFMSLKSAQDYERWFTAEIIGPMIQLIEGKRDNQYKSISQKVKDLIHYDFAIDLTLEMCAGKLNYHPSYIGQVFRKETGLNFSDYLAQYRLDIAKQWLAETNMKIAEIAEKLKYTNPQNFIRYFRKIEGVTPGQYREEHQQDKEGSRHQ